MRLESPLRPLVFTALAAVFFGAAAGCHSVTPRPRVEDVPRRVAPIPACLHSLGQHGPRTEGVFKSLNEDQYWSFVYTDYDVRKKTLGPSARACTGLDVFNDPELAGAQPLRGWPETVREGDMSLGSGPDRLKIAWLRTHGFKDGTYGGALTLVRSYESSAEIYGVGIYRGSIEHSTFTIERLGPELVVLGQDDGCTGLSGPQDCESHVSVYTPRLGRLKNLAQIPLERVAYATDSEPGVHGRVKYHLSSTPSYVDGGIRLLEQVEVTDELGRVIRRAELDRTLTFAPGARLIASDESIWPRIYRTTKAGAKDSL